jgi:hypothetical protein
MAAAPSTTPEVALALANIEAAKLVDPDIAECLDAIGDLIRITGKPEAIYAWVAETLGREHLKQYAARHRITVHESRAVDTERLAKTVIIWAADGAGMALIPTGQAPAITLLQLREEIAQREEDAQRALDFQASIAAGHVEDVDTWHARTTRPGK